MSTQYQEQQQETMASQDTARLAWSEEQTFSKIPTYVTILVGKDEDKYILPKDLACYHCPVFAAAFNSPFVEGQTQTYRLDDVDPKIFDLMVRYMYASRVRGIGDLADVSIGGKKVGEKPDFNDENVQQVVRVKTERLVALWILADRLLMTAAQNAVMKQLLIGLIEHYTFGFEAPGSCKFVNTEWINLAWHGTASPSPLKDLARHYLLVDMPTCGYAENPDHFPEELLLARLRDLMEMDDYFPIVHLRASCRSLASRESHERESQLYLDYSTRDWDFRDLFDDKTVFPKKILLELFQRSPIQDLTKELLYL